MKRKLITEAIIKSEGQPLSDADLSILTAKRNKQLLIILSGYLPLAAILLFVFINGITVITRKKLLLQELKVTEEREEMFNAVAPYTCGFFFLVLTAFFIHYYIQTLAPLLKDLRKKKKSLLHYIPEKTEMAFFNRFYLSSPVVKKQQILVSREDFYAIVNGSPVIIELAPCSQTVFRFTYNGKEIKVS